MNGEAILAIKQDVSGSLGSAGVKSSRVCRGRLAIPSSMSEILNRLGYRLRKVVKAKPLKKVEETDAIFENSNYSGSEVTVTDQKALG